MPHLSPVPVDDLPVYPIPATERLDSHSFVKWNHQRWMASRTFKLATWEVQGMARALFDFAQTESPIGTLPDDLDELAVMLRCDLRRMRELRTMEMGPLRNWRPCLTVEGARRLYHPVILEQVQDALERRDLRALSSEAKARAQRIKRLREALGAEGLSAAVLADEVLIQRMDEWLEAHHKGNRTKAVYRSAILHAQQMKWFGGLRETV
ncbi:hypothetical protein [Paragemmobacter ruber]|uniref:Integrase n=1 Tax=Paragemmobacter ruber TaxID=1985673 RepID=A0ABW9Y238_9RHOB|nr:hypothetical protein [Rhodobacter ruber]NBE05945.1 hypothetical protein [Rhodobacter ruber]